jgi:HEAT repeat protein
MIYDEDAFVRETARLVLRERTLEVRLHRDLLSSASTKRIQAALVLGEIGDLAPETLEALLTVAQDLRAKSEIREAALLTLVELRSPIDKETLYRLLDDKDESVRAAALLLYTILEPDRSYPYGAAGNIIQFEVARKTKGKTGARNKRQPGA